MIEGLMASAEDHLSFRSNEVTNATTPARMTAGPKLLAGARVYIITARNIKASATDLWVWLPPSMLATGTVKRLVNAVSASSSTKDPNPLHPRNGNFMME